MFLLLLPLKSQQVKEHTSYPETNPLLKVHTFVLIFSVRLFFVNPSAHYIKAAGPRAQTVLKP